MMRTALTLLAVAALAACGGGGDPAPATQTHAQPVASTPSPAPSPAQTVPPMAAQPAVQEPAPVARPAAPAPVAAPAPEPVAQVPEPPPPATPTPEPEPAPRLVCSYNQGGFPIYCDPRWPYPGQQPSDGATADQVEGWNAICTTVSCMQYRCQDGRVVNVRISGSCMAPAPTTARAAP